MEYLDSLLAMLGDIPHTAITVVDNASGDDTARIAERSGARVLHEARIGKGFAAVTGIRAAGRGRVFLCDADVAGLTTIILRDLIELADGTSAPVVRLAMGRSPEDAPVTTLTALPLLRALGIQGIKEPLGGLMMVDRDFVLSEHLPGGWGFDVALTLAGLRQAGAVPELETAGVSHRRKPLESYRSMASEVAATILASTGMTRWDHCTCTKCLSTADTASEVDDVLDLERTPSGGLSSGGNGATGYMGSRSGPTRG